VACLTLQYFSTLSHTGRDFQKIVIKHELRVLIHSTTVVCSISHSNNNYVRYDKKMYVGLHVKSDVDLTRILMTDLKKNTPVSYFMIIHPLGSKLLHAYVWTVRNNEANSRLLLF
jgi:hypothetical protein